MITVLGAPGCAVRVAKAASVELLSGRIIACESRISVKGNKIADNSPEFLVGGSGFPSILNRRQWVPSNSLMLRTSDDFAVSAPGGMYCVDVPEGSQFFVKPSKVVACSLGTGPPKEVHFDTRLDVMVAWTRWLANKLVHVISKISRATSHVYQLVTKRQPLPWTLPWTLPWSGKEIWGKRYWTYLKNKGVEATQKKTLKYEGPCSLIIKP